MDGRNMYATEPSVPPSKAMTAAQVWAEAKDRLQRADGEKAQAESALAQAREAEQKAWAVLEEAAGRVKSGIAASAIGPFRSTL